MSFPSSTYFTPKKKRKCKDSENVLLSLFFRRQKSDTVLYIFRMYSRTGNEKKELCENERSNEMEKPPPEGEGVYFEDFSRIFVTFSSATHSKVVQKSKEGMKNGELTSARFEVEFIIFLLIASSET